MRGRVPQAAPATTGHRAGCPGVRELHVAAGLLGMATSWNFGSATLRGLVLCLARRMPLSLPRARRPAPAVVGWRQGCLRAAAVLARPRDVTIAAPQPHGRVPLHAPPCCCWRRFSVCARERMGTLGAWSCIARTAKQAQRDDAQPRAHAHNTQPFTVTARTRSSTAKMFRAITSLFWRPLAATPPTHSSGDAVQDEEELTREWLDGAMQPGEEQAGRTQCRPVRGAHVPVSQQIVRQRTAKSTVGRAIIDAHLLVNVGRALPRCAQAAWPSSSCRTSPPPQRCSPPRCPTCGCTSWPRTSARSGRRRTTTKRRAAPSWLSSARAPPAATR